MAAERIGSVKTGKTRRSIDVKWDQSGGEVYVQWAGWTKVGKASSAREAMNKAEAYLYDK
ncbi:MAG: hypothetical protein JXR48_06975 [Candidatus Delongbacteria bacterium]|nr:hypothetical protein [Candidatus Delongbacteria bacterium]